MREEEIMIRAREAAMKAIPPRTPTIKMAVLAGEEDHQPSIQSAMIALRDLAKPIEEIAPKPADPDLAEARKLASQIARRPSADDALCVDAPARVLKVLNGEYDQSPAVQDALAAIRRGRELALNDLLTPEGLTRLGIEVRTL